LGVENVEEWRHRDQWTPMEEAFRGYLMLHAMMRKWLVQTQSEKPARRAAFGHPPLS
jgi:hypothetical protein